MVVVPPLTEVLVDVPLLMVEVVVVDEPLVMVEVVEFCHPLPFVVIEREAVTMFPA